MTLQVLQDLSPENVIYEFQLLITVSQQYENLPTIPWSPERLFKCRISFTELFNLAT